MSLTVPDDRLNEAADRIAALVAARRCRTRSCRSAACGRRRSCRRAPTRATPASTWRPSRRAGSAAGRPRRRRHGPRRGDPAGSRRAWCCRARGSRAATASPSPTRPGLIDAGYRGELTVLLVNLGEERHTGRARRPHRPAGAGPGRAWPRAVEVEELPPSDGRGEGGFGSTG